MADVTLKIVLDDKHAADTPEMDTALEAAGLRVEEKIPEIGVIFGTADQSRLDAIRTLKGVLEVLPEESVQLPPISKDVPQ